MLVRANQARLKNARSARRLWRAPQYTKKAAPITKQGWIDRAHLAQTDKTGGVVVGQETQELACQDEGGNPLLVKGSCLAAQAHPLTELHIG